MDGIGQALREARMRQGIDISVVEQETKIRAKYLRALENEDFDLLPGSTFVKSFLKTYAEFLGLDQQLFVEEYRAQHEPRHEADMPPFAPRPRGGRERSYGRGPPGRGTVIALAAGLLLVFLVVLGVTGDDGGTPGDPGRTTTSPSPRPRADRPAREREREREPAARPRRVSLRVLPSEPTYVCVDDGEGTVLFEGQLPEARTFRGPRIRINLGRTSAELRVNGRRVEFDEGPDAVGFDFRPGRTTPVAEADRPCV